VGRDGFKSGQIGLDQFNFLEKSGQIGKFDFFTKSVWVVWCQVESDVGFIQILS
jgi:hypothetical protein